MKPIEPASAIALTSARDIPVEVEGKAVTVKATPLNRRITANDRDAGAQDTALACSFLYYGHLSRADIPKAAALSTDPKATSDKMAQYQDRIGAEEFRKTMTEYFTANNVILAELTIGDAVMIVVKTAEYTAGQMYVSQGGKWLVEERAMTETGRAFGKVLRMIQGGMIAF